MEKNNKQTLDEYIAERDALVKAAWGDDTDNDYVIADIKHGEDGIYAGLYNRDCNAVISATLPYIFAACIKRKYKVANLYEAWLMIEKQYEIS